MSIGRMPYDKYFLEMAEVVSKRSTCIRRAVGCILIYHRRHVLATGYNGVAAGMPHCNEIVQEPREVLGGGIVVADTHPYACDGAYLPSTTGLDACEAIHAEANALLQCRDVYMIDAAYITVSPCVHCVKLLLNTTCRRLVFPKVYDEKALGLWRKADRIYDIVS